MNEEFASKEESYHPPKVTLNLTRAALERLIGGNTEMEVGLRQQIVDKFAEERLRPLLNTNEIGKQIAASIASQQKYIQDRVSEKFNGMFVENSNYYRPQLKPEIVQMITNQVRATVATTVTEAINNIDFSDLQKELEKRLLIVLESRLKNVITALQSDKIKELVQKALDNNG